MNYFRGNVFESFITEDGKISVTQDVINYDENPNGRSAYKQLPGSIQKEQIEPQNYGDENANYLNSNGLAANNISYADGDLLNARNAEDEDSMMYSDPFSEASKRVRQENEKRLTLVSNTTRVIKGASWKDRAFWLDPAQRRYMPEFLGADYIGFRCAMSYLGTLAATESHVVSHQTKSSILQIANSHVSALSYF